jgi:hypothetical protein
MQKQIWKKIKLEASMRNKNLFFGTLSFKPLQKFIMVAYRRSSKNIRKMKSQPILNKNSPWCHTKLKLGMLGIAKKLMKDGIHSRPKQLGKIYFSPNRMSK